MARKRLFDHLQSYKFWLLDISPSLRIPFVVLNPLWGFNTITAPEVTLETESIEQFNSLWPRHAYSGGSVGPITVTRGAQVVDSSFFSWIKLAALGLERPQRNLLLLQYTGWQPIGQALADSFGLDNAGGIGPIGLGQLQIPGKAWMLWGCVPTRYKGGTDFDATSGEVSIQELELQPVMVEELSLL